ncbi:LON peptidase substrate-binding domain-containing protein [bacterium]|nr:LON peptidase substrate-binding domain-containing protein [bacterium]MCI0606086.1 LON peptidase substrate-binding domain-containing protein [bacterium]
MQPDVVAVFPLPNVVFFPQTNLPLHIFEPRYCEMVKETIENQQMIGMFLLQPGWQDDYYGNPPIFSIGCAGELSYVENLPEGKYNIVLRGITRIRALETVQEIPYRKVRVHILPDKVEAGEAEVKTVKKSLLRNFGTFAKHMQNLDASLIQDSDLIEMVNLIASVLPLDIEEKRRLLELDDAYLRAMAVDEHLSGAVAVLRLTANFSHLRPTDPNIN